MEMTNHFNHRGYTINLSATFGLMIDGQYHHDKCRIAISDASRAIIVKSIDVNDNEDEIIAAIDSMKDEAIKLIDYREGIRTALTATQTALFRLGFSRNKL